MELRDFFPIWNQLASGQQETLIESTIRRAIPKGTLLHSGSMDCTGLLLVQHGQLRAYILSEEGREITLYRLLEGDICLFSASCIMRSIQFEVMIEAEKDTELWIIPADSYKAVMDQSAPLANFTNEVMAGRFSDVMWLLEQILWKRFDQRLAGFLLEERALEGTDVLKITHETIGSHLGNPREVVTRMLRYFQNEGLVKLARGTVEITNRAAMQKQYGT